MLEIIQVKNVKEESTPIKPQLEDEREVLRWNYTVTTQDNKEYRYGFGFPRPISAKTLHNNMTIYADVEADRIRNILPKKEFEERIRRLIKANEEYAVRLNEINDRLKGYLN